LLFQVGRIREAAARGVDVWGSRERLRDYAEGKGRAMIGERFTAR